MLKKLTSRKVLFIVGTGIPRPDELPDSTPYEELGKGIECLSFRHQTARSRQPRFRFSRSPTRSAPFSSGKCRRNGRLPYSPGSMWDHTSQSLLGMYAMMDWNNSLRFPRGWSWIACGPGDSQAGKMDQRASRIDIPPLINHLLVSPYHRPRHHHCERRTSCG